MLATMAVGRPIKPAALFSEASPHRLRFFRRRGPSASVPVVCQNHGSFKRVRQRRRSGRRHTGFGAATALHVAVAILEASAISAAAATLFGLGLGLSTEATRLPKWDVVGSGDSLVSPRHLDGAKLATMRRGNLNGKGLVRCCQGREAKNFVAGKTESLRSGSSRYFER